MIIRGLLILSCLAGVAFGQEPNDAAERVKKAQAALEAGKKAANDPAELKRINAKLRAENARLRAENAKLRSLLAKRPPAQITQGRSAPKKTLEFSSLKAMLKAMPKSAYPGRGRKWDGLLLNVAQKWFDENVVGKTVEIDVRFRTANMEKPRGQDKEVVVGIFAPNWYKLNPNRYPEIGVLTEHNVEWHFYRVKAEFDRSWISKLSKLRGETAGNLNRGTRVKLRGKIKSLKLKNSPKWSLPRAGMEIRLEASEFK